MDMSDDPRVPRRAVLAGAAGAAGVGLASGLGSDEADGTIYGGIMALNEAYNVSGDLWIGPDSAKGNVAAESGRVYMASDTQVEYYGDGGGWVKMGVGSPSEPVPAVTTEQLNNAKDGEPFETLEQAGYESGDYLPIWSSYGQTAEEYSTTSSDYVTVDLVFQRVNDLPFILFPNDEMQPAVAWEGQFVGNGRDGNHGIRIINEDYTLGENNNQSSQGWIEFNPDNLTTYSYIITQIKSGTEGEVIRMRRFSLLFGVKI